LFQKMFTVVLFFNWTFSHKNWTLTGLGPGEYS
jgi:hypothetical protein